MPSAVLVPTPWPCTVDGLILLLKIRCGPDVRCHGKKTSKSNKSDDDSCRNKVSKASWATVLQRLQQIAASGAVAKSKALLVEAASLLVCKQAHQGQASVLLASWMVILASVEDRPDLADQPGSPCDEPSSSRTVKDEPSPDVEPIRAVLASIPRVTQRSSETGSNALGNHSFEAFGPRKSTRALNKLIQQIILKPLSETDLTKCQSGMVYIYTFPNVYRTRSPYLKIGNTKDVNARMRQWRGDCGYEPKVLSTFTADYYVRVERLVHIQLHNERLRERACPGCGRHHREWFQVTVNKASHAAGLWTSWTRQEPYDDQGNLKSSWALRALKVDLDDPCCWEEFVNYVDEDDSVKEETDDDDYDDETSEDTTDDDESVKSETDEDDEAIGTFHFMDHDRRGRGLSS